MTRRPYVYPWEVPPVRFRDLQQDFVRYLEARAKGYDSPDSTEVSEDRAIKRACARFFGALDAVLYAAEKVAAEPGADPDAVYMAYRERAAGIIDSLRDDHKHPTYATKDPHEILCKTLRSLRNTAYSATHRPGIITADAYKEIAKHVEKVAAGPSVPRRHPAGSPTGRNPYGDRSGHP